MNKKRIVLFGAGNIFKAFMSMYDADKVDVLAACDNNSSLQGTQVCGIEVCGPDKIVNLHCDYVVVTSSYFEEIKHQVIQLGFEDKSIINFYEVYKKLSVHNDIVVDLLKDDLFISISLQKSWECEFQTVRDMQEKSLLLSAKIFINQICKKQIDSLEEAEFQVFSQFGEDGIIQWLIHNIELNEKTFVEFGVEDYTEANTRFLLMNNNWTGLVIDGSKENIDRLKHWKLFWKYDLNAVAAFITKDNINEIISAAGFEGDIGLLSVDIDGNDYWVLNAITCIKPRILICEYNNIFGFDKKVSIPYDEKYFRTEKHYSNLYWGASLGAFCDWAEQKGYYYVGSNSAGNNAFFVRRDCICEDKIPSGSKKFVSSKYRESRDKNGCLTYLRGMERLKEIKDMELVDINNNRIVKIADMYHL